MPCFGPSSEQRALAFARDELNTLKADKDVLLRQNDQLRTDNRMLHEKYQKMEAMIAEQLNSMTTQLNSQVQESKRQVDESKRQAAAAQEQVETCRLEIQHLQAARKTDQSLITDAQTKTHALEMRVQRHQRERAKLLDQIQRRDQALFLARQVIDMVEKSGVLGLDASFGLAAALGPAPTMPTAPAPRTSSKGTADALSHQQAAALQDLRKSIPAMRAALRATAPPPEPESLSGSPGPTELSPKQDTAYTSKPTEPQQQQVDSGVHQTPRSVSRMGSGEMGLNPLWEPEAVCVDRVSIQLTPRTEDVPQSGVVVVACGDDAPKANSVGAEGATKAGNAGTASHRTTADSQVEPGAEDMEVCKVMLSNSRDVSNGRRYGQLGVGGGSSRDSSVSG